MFGGPKKTKIEEAREFLAGNFLAHVPVSVDHNFICKHPSEH